MSNWPRRTGIAVALTLIVSLAHAGQPGQVYRVFESPQKNFSVQQPDFPFGTHVEKAHDKTGGVVAFSGGDGEFQRIDWFAIPANSPVPTDSTEQHAYYHRLLAAFLQTHPNTVLSERDTVIDGVTMFQALVSMPGGSTLVDQRSGKRVDAVRAILYFAHGTYVYMLQDEVGAPVFHSPGEVQTQKDYEIRAAEALPALYRTMKFH